MNLCNRSLFDLFFFYRIGAFSCIFMLQVVKHLHTRVRDSHSDVSHNRLSCLLLFDPQGRQFAVQSTLFKKNTIWPASAVRLGEKCPVYRQARCSRMTRKRRATTNTTCLFIDVCIKGAICHRSCQ